jgi:hypothetical protein
MTYAWINATPISIIVSIICSVEPINILLNGRKIKKSPIKDISKCPAIRLAVSRKVKAKGRIIFLKISTKIINLISPKGVPVGTR